MYFKIVPIEDTKYTNMGMIEVMAEFYLEPNDIGYDDYIAEHLHNLPIEPYPNFVVEGNIYYIKDKDDYDDWFSKVKKKEVLTPFCIHSIQFEYDVTEDEILYCFEWALAMSHQNYLKKDLICQKGGQLVNQPFDYIGRKERGATDDVKNNTRNKVGNLKKIDFTKLDKSKLYKVK